MTCGTLGIYLLLVELDQLFVFLVARYGEFTAAVIHTAASVYLIVVRVDSLHLALHLTTKGRWLHAH